MEDQAFYESCQSVSADAPKPCHICSSLGRHEEWCSAADAPEMRSEAEVRSWFDVIDKTANIDGNDDLLFLQGYRNALKWVLREEG